MEAQEKISGEGLKHFVKHLILTYQKADERQKARQNLSQQFLKAKQAAVAKKMPQWAIEKEFRNLERKMEIALGKESRLLRIHQEESGFISELRNKIEKLEAELQESCKSRQQIDEMKYTLGDLRDKIGQLLEHQVVRKQRIDELEQKISKKSEKNAMVIGMESKLSELENRYAELRRKKYSAQQLKRLEEKINALKSALENKKS